MQFSDKRSAVFAVLLAGSVCCLAHCTLTGLADHNQDLSAFCFGSDSMGFLTTRKRSLKGHLFQLFLSEVCKLHILVLCFKLYTASAA